MRKKRRQKMLEAQSQGPWAYAKWFYKDKWAQTMKVAGAAALGKVAYEHRDEIAGAVTGIAGKLGADVSGTEPATSDAQVGDGPVEAENVEVRDAGGAGSFHDNGNYGG